jgi:hypothetical protein
MRTVNEMPHPRACGATTHLIPRHAPFEYRTAFANSVDAGTQNLAPTPSGRTSYTRRWMIGCASSSRRHAARLCDGGGARRGNNA